MVAFDLLPLPSLQLPPAPVQLAPSAVLRGTCALEMSGSVMDTTTARMEATRLTAVSRAGGGGGGGGGGGV